MIALRGMALVAVTLGSSQAHAAVDWCGLAAAAPSSSVTFEQGAAQLSRLGCDEQAQQSAHMRAWKCTDREPGDTHVLLYRVTEGYRSTTLLLIGNAALEDLDRFRPCSTQASTTPYGRWSPSARRAFEAGSIVVRDRASLRSADYATSTMTLLRLGSRAYAVAAYPDSSYPASAITIAELGLFGIQRVAYPSTRAEVAGKNVVTSPTSEIVAGLQSRGARIIDSDPESNFVARMTLTPPVGLEGVREIEVSSVNDHAYQIVYKINTEADYMNFVRLLDERYGRSRVEDGGAMKGCRVRHWTSGNVGLLGALCEDRGYELSFINDVVSKQLSAHRDYLARPREQPAERPRIDPDNL